MTNESARCPATHEKVFVVAEDDHTVAFLDRGQASDGPTLLVPRPLGASLYLRQADRLTERQAKSPDGCF